MLWRAQRGYLRDRADVCHPSIRKIRPRTDEMTNAGPIIRDCRANDIPAVQAIYAHHVLHGMASFEEIPPDVAEMTLRFETLQASEFPYLVGVAENVVAGYAYAGPYRHRSAYRYTVENAIYVDTNQTGKGLGRALLSELIERCTARGFRQMLAVIGDADNHASIGLHTALGFERTAFLPSVGFRHGR